ncbi:toxin Tbo-IT2 [Dendroctonus ponderosae]|uniref:EGF-like domain-containing protein n=1 Tax=Dendroctonus ponderosae TaxID=77166 RepID=J3JW87_DENPD|nr:toxin Tbo-IT2 [Dendroctonus ponderosae]AEE62467.1 unknown [Dendroctonus ponderosae]
MKIAWLVLASCVLVLAHAAVPYFDDDQAYPASEDDYSENSIDRTLQQPAEKRKSSSIIYLFRRACIRRGGNCDHRANDCCYNSSCRCNLWGSNCRCQRMGIFQKWG